MVHSAGGTPAGEPADGHAKLHRYHAQARLSPSAGKLHRRAMRNALLLLGNPDPRSFNAELARSYAQSFIAAGGSATTIDLGQLNFDLVLRRGFREPQPLEPDLEKVRQAIEAADHVVWLFPIYWGSPPALVRGLVDRVFLPNWAFRYNGGALPEGLLRGRSARVIATMDSPAWWYALAHRWALHATMGTGTLRFSGFSPVRFSSTACVKWRPPLAASRSSASAASPPKTPAAPGRAAHRSRCRCGKSPASSWPMSAERSVG